MISSQLAACSRVSSPGWRQWKTEWRCCPAHQQSCFSSGYFITWWAWKQPTGVCLHAQVKGHRCFQSSVNCIFHTRDGLFIHLDSLLIGLNMTGQLQFSPSPFIINYIVIVLITKLFVIYCEKLKRQLASGFSESLFSTQRCFIDVGQSFERLEVPALEWSSAEVPLDQ